MVPHSTSMSAGNSHTDESVDTEGQHELERKQSQAIEEGHDADIPSSAGYILDARGRERRRHSLASRGRSVASKEGIDLEGGVNSARNGADDDTSNPNEIWWDGPNDPENPYNWPLWKKYANCGLVSLMTFVTPLGSCMEP